MQFTDPEALEEHLSTVGGEVSIRPVAGSRFRANIDIRLQERVGLFTVDADSFSAQKLPQQEFYSLNIPLNVPFTVSESGKDQIFSNANAYMLSPGRPFAFKCKEKCYAMACNFFVDFMETYRGRMLQETTASEPFLNPQVSLMSVAGSRLFRTAIRTWVALGEKDIPVNEIALKEMEDDLLASFLMLVEDRTATSKLAALPSTNKLNNIEDYICANLDSAITRDDLADRAGVSVRSLSRGFEKKYGLGPMAFIRQRRLDASYIQLLGLERSAITVTEVAMSLGFEHVGKFAIAYKIRFGESPSTTLSR
jgi:AraC-like DNA-binding protein